MTIVESTKELEDMRTFHLPQFSMRGKIITFSAVTLSLAALGTVAYQSISLPGEMGAFVYNYSSSSSSTISSTSSNTSSSSSESTCGDHGSGMCGGTCTGSQVCGWDAEANDCACLPSICNGSGGQCGGACSSSAHTCAWSTEAGMCECLDSSTSSTSSSVSSSVCSSNPGAILPNCPTAVEVPNTCDPSTCESDWFNGMCVNGGLCATIKGQCADNSGCNEEFQLCGSPGARQCSGYCADYGEECQNLGTDRNGDIICGCRSYGYSSSF